MDTSNLLHQVCEGSASSPNETPLLFSWFPRSCERSLRSLDQESPPKKKKLQPACTSTTHLLAGKKCPSSLQTKSNDMETTVFYIPGVDVKVSVSLGSVHGPTST